MKKDNEQSLKLFQGVIAFCELPQNESKSASFWQSGVSSSGFLSLIVSASAGSGNPASDCPWLNGPELMGAAILGFNQCIMVQHQQYANANWFSLLGMCSPGEQVVAEFDHFLSHSSGLIMMS